MHRLFLLSFLVGGLLVQQTLVNAADANSAAEDEKALALANSIIHLPLPSFWQTANDLTFSEATGISSSGSSASGLGIGGLAMALDALPERIRVIDYRAYRWMRGIPEITETYTRLNLWLASAGSSVSSSASSSSLIATGIFDGRKNTLQQPDQIKQIRRSSVFKDLSQAIGRERANDFVDDVFAGMSFESAVERNFPEGPNKRDILGAAASERFKVETLLAPYFTRTDLREHVVNVVVAQRASLVAMTQKVSGGARDKLIQSLDQHEAGIRKLLRAEAATYPRHQGTGTETPSRSNTAAETH
jgi:hypothetical protein